MTNNSHSKRKPESVDQESKRQRFIWTRDLHESFIASIFDIGIAHITSTKLMETASQAKKDIPHGSLDRFISTLQGFRFEDKALSLEQVQELTKIPTAKLHLLDQPPSNVHKKPVPKQIAKEPSISPVQPVAKPKKVKKKVVSLKAAPVLSKEALLPYSAGTFLHKEFPNLKDLHLPSKEFLLSLQRTYGLVASSSDSTVSENTRPFSPLSSDIDSYEFDWERETFDSNVIKMYLEA